MAPTSTIPPVPFIVGVARSGTTLLRLMLDQHSQLAILPETHFIPNLLKQQPQSPQQLHHIITHHFTWPDFGLNTEELQHALNQISPYTLEQGIRIFYALYAHKHQKQRWGDKTPPYLTHIADIAQAFPEAAIIHLIRDGRAIAASRRHLNFGPGNNITAQAQDWVNKIQTARQQAPKCPNYLEIHYENLIQRPEETLQIICKELKIDYQTQMLEYWRTAQARLNEFQDWQTPTGEILSPGAYRKAIHHRTHTPPDASRINDWRNQLTQQEITEFNNNAAPLLNQLGYKP